MPAISSLTDRTLRSLAGAIILVCVAIALWSSDYVRSYPLINIVPGAKGNHFAPLILTALPLLLLGLPVALSLFRSAMVYLVLFSLISIPLAGTALYSVANIMLGGDRPETIEAMVVEKRESGRGRGRSYLLQIAPVFGREHYEFAPNYRFYNGVSVGDRLVVRVNSGFFGRRWVASYEKSNR